MGLGSGPKFRSGLLYNNLTSIILQNGTVLEFHMNSVKLLKHNRKTGSNNFIVLNCSILNNGKGSD